MSPVQLILSVFCFRITITITITYNYDDKTTCAFRHVFYIFRSYSRLTVFLLVVTVRWFSPTESRTFQLQFADESNRVKNVIIFTRVLFKHKTISYDTLTNLARSADSSPNRWDLSERCYCNIFCRNGRVRSCPFSFNESIGFTTMRFFICL